MKKFAILCAVLIFAVSFINSAFAQNNSAGSSAIKSVVTKAEDSPLLSNWEINIAAPGQDLPGTLKLEKDGDNFKGSLTTQLGEAPFKNVKIKEDKTFTADITVNAQGQTIEGTINGKLAEEKLTGEISLPGFGAIPYAGKKAEK